MARLRLDGLTKIFPAKPHPVRAVEGLTFALEEGELMVLLGPSGCGKTTTLRLIAGLEEPSSGSIQLDGKSIESTRAEARPIGMAFQSPALFPQLTVSANVELGLRLRKVAKADRQKRLLEILALLEIVDLKGRYPEQLSGGQQQRVSLARALAASPRVFLLDEPLASLDPGARVQLRGAIKRVQRQTGTPMIYVTHDQAEALAVADRIAVMQRGAIEQIGTPSEVYYTPATLFVAQFIGSPPMNLFDGVLDPEKRLLEIPQLKLSIPSPFEETQERKVIVGMRPENVHLREGGSIEARVAEVTPAFPDIDVHWECGGRLIIARAPFASEIKVGTHARFDLDWRAAHFFETVTGHRVTPLH